MTFLCVAAAFRLLQQAAPPPAGQTALHPTSLAAHVQGVQGTPTTGAPAHMGVSSLRHEPASVSSEQDSLLHVVLDVLLEQPGLLWRKTPFGKRAASLKLYVVTWDFEVQVLSKVQDQRWHGALLQLRELFFSQGAGGRHTGLWLSHRCGAKQVPQYFERGIGLRS